MNVDKPKINFGTRVDELLTMRNISARDFYTAIGIAPQAYYDWKKKDQVPYATTALKVANYFGVTVEYLITGETDNPLQKKVEELQKRNLELANKLRVIADELATS
ncbi:DNA-binding transcriptional regulator, XRE-family HTH domain [Treponema bryantii]|uniref:DNA-binding transcriptional regulator, XRE-family HTH domain n=1 Tax=Treponema bryantii TaxID=163 RepID=A0A1H9B200_9SPIR|nr:helix-turn-helix transcriptional regulator [Treponema bryantii]SEP82879.1 DNA-binding transcriptional regulator, XRE-family HTH domain [Treponema bryantii]